MRTSLAWSKVTHNKLRTAASLSGVCFAIVLIFMQLGFYDASFRSATMIYDQLDFDLVLVSPHYYNLILTGTVARRRLLQARAVPGVARASPFYVLYTTFRNPQTGVPREVVVLGIDPDQSPFRELAPGGTPGPPAEWVGRLKKADTGIWDSKSQKGYGDVRPGTVAEVGLRDVEVVATYAHGTGFITPALLIVGIPTVPHILGGYPLDDVNLGLVKLAPGADRQAVVAALRSALPDDVEVWTRSHLEAVEQNYFVRVKPVGIMFSSGVVLAFVVGAVILYQILASEVINHLKEYATLRALGYSNGYVNRVVLQQATLFAVLGFLPATLFALGIYTAARLAVYVPMYMTWGRVGFVLVLSVAMCGGSGLLVIRQVARADPADLF
jgi:putative ABC transport system permease protein